LQLAEGEATSAASHVMPGSIVHQEVNESNQIKMIRYHPLSSTIYIIAWQSWQDFIGMWPKLAYPSELPAVSTEAVSLAQNLFQVRLTQVCKWL